MFFWTSLRFLTPFIFSFKRVSWQAFCLIRPFYNFIYIYVTSKFSVFDLCYTFVKKEVFTLEKTRCPWALQSLLEQEYHDQQWGKPTYDDPTLFEYLVLESMQAGLSWALILKKKKALAEAFASFDPAIIATFTAREVERLVTNAEIIRHRGKIQATITNAQAFLAVQKEFGSFSHYFWAFVDHIPQNPSRPNTASVPVQTSLSQTISKDLKKRGFKFVGPTIVYSLMQATGLINDHLDNCFCKTLPGEKSRV